MKKAVHWRTRRVLAIFPPETLQQTIKTVYCQYYQHCGHDATSTRAATTGEKAEIIVARCATTRTFLRQSLAIRPFSGVLGSSGRSEKNSSTLSLSVLAFITAIEKRSGAMLRINSLVYFLAESSSLPSPSPPPTPLPTPYAIAHSL